MEKLPVTPQHQHDVEMILDAFREDAEAKSYEEEYAEIVRDLIPGLHAHVEVPDQEFEFTLDGDLYGERRTILVRGASEAEALERLLLVLRGMSGVEVERY